MILHHSVLWSPHACMQCIWIVGLCYSCHMVFVHEYVMKVGLISPWVPRLKERREDEQKYGGNDSKVVNVASKDLEQLFHGRKTAFSWVQASTKNVTTWKICRGKCQRNRLLTERLDTLMLISAEGPHCKSSSLNVPWWSGRERNIEGFFSQPVMDCD